MACWVVYKKPVRNNIQRDHSFGIQTSKLRPSKGYSNPVSIPEIYRNSKSWTGSIMKHPRNINISTLPPILRMLRPHHRIADQAFDLALSQRNSWCCGENPFSNPNVEPPTVPPVQVMLLTMDSKWPKWDIGRPIIPRMADTQIAKQIDTKVLLAVLYCRGSCPKWSVVISLLTSSGVSQWTLQYLLSPLARV